jgi:hypothetical protein
MGELAIKHSEMKNHGLHGRHGFGNTYPPGRAARLIGAVLPVCLSICAAPVHAKEVMNELDLSGEWAFRMDEKDVGLKEQWFSQKLPETIQLPGSMPEQRKGKPVGYDTGFTGSFWKKYGPGESWPEDQNYKPFLKEDDSGSRSG